MRDDGCGVYGVGRGVGDAMTQQLVLSLFPGIGLLDMAFEQEGFCVVRGPDVLWGGDVRSFHPPAGKFDGVIGGPPCQAFSRLAHMVRQNGLQPKFGNLIPEYERCVSEAEPPWFLMENVPDSPLPAVHGYGVHTFLLNNRQCVADDGKPAVQNRVRRWSFGVRGERRILAIDTVVFENGDFERAALGGTDRREITVKLGGSGKPKTTLPFNAKSKTAVADLCRKQGLPADFFKHSPFTVEAKCKAVGNGVPLPMGRAIARAVKESLNL
jgi:DNA (cytosine-5)-methyltransferase 1